MARVPKGYGATIYTKKELADMARFVRDLINDGEYEHAADVARRLAQYAGDKGRYENR